MTEKEKQAIENLAEAIQKMNDRQREQLVSFAEGIAFAMEKKAG